MSPSPAHDSRSAWFATPSLWGSFIPNSPPVYPGAFGQQPEEVLADSGYCSEKNLESLEAPEKPERKIDAYIATNRQKRGRRAGPAPRGRIPRAATRVERMQRKLRTKAGAKIYAQRKGIVEPIFGQIKQARGIRQFLLCGFQKVQGEWALVCLTHNILKMHTLCYG